MTDCRGVPPVVDLMSARPVICQGADNEQEKGNQPIAVADRERRFER